ncbi:MAG: hypothetical protein JW741_00770 [Sedimentisphaerales bacterium]|nr:hypothetical protein [Sedimentisphaerales bacterium]
MRPAENLRKSFRKLRVATSAELDESIGREIRRAAEEAGTPRPDRRVPGTLGTMVKTRIVKLAAAAILIAAILGLHQFNGSLRGTSIAWSEVAERLENVSSYKARAHRVLTEVGQEEPFFECEILRYFSPDHGSVEESYEDGELVMLAYCSLSEKAAIVVFPQNKVYFRFDLNEELMSLVEYANPANTEGIMKLFGSERCVRLGSREFDGVRAEGFEVKDVQIFSQVPRFLLHVKDIDVRLWVDNETLLPARIEGEGLFEGLMTLSRNCKYEEVMHDIEYDVQIDEKIFEPNIPDDYKCVDPAATAGKAELVLLVVLPCGTVTLVTRRITRRLRRTRRVTG